MSKYNKKVALTQVKTTSHQGGTAFTQKAEHELIGLLSTGLDNTYYEKEGEREKRFTEVFNKVASKNKLFAAKALIYARTVFGQRTVTHRGAVELIKHLQGDQLGKKFFSKRARKENVGGIVFRIDDMNEILACYLAKNGQDASLPNSIKKGFRDAIEHADAYSLAKYQMKNKTVSLVDIVNLVHPKETKINGFITLPKDEYTKAVKNTKFTSVEVTETDEGVQIPTLRALVLGVLKQFNTVEDKNTSAGKKVAEAVKSGEISKEDAVKVLNESKTDNYKELIETKKIGYLALLRNVRNILKTNDVDLLTKACGLLTEQEFIKRSLIWPHQIDLCLEVMLDEFSGQSLTKVAEALNTAYERSIPNLRALLPEGRTAVVFDTSGSMSGRWGAGVQIGKDKTSKSTPLEKASLVAATLAKGIGADVYHFATGSEQVTGWNPMDTINTLKNKFVSYSGRKGHGTDFGACWDEFRRLNKQYDRVIIISDEQDGYGQTEESMGAYNSQFGTPYVYIVNVCGYAPVATKAGSKTFRLFGYGADIYEKMPVLEINPAIVISEINKIVI